MNQTIILWLFGAYQSILTLALASGIGWLILIVQRLTKVETILALIADKAAAILHSPHTPELDALLEKYCDRTYTMTELEWEKLRRMCGEIEDNLSLPKEERALAAFVGAAAEHELELPVSKPKKHE